MARTTRRTRSRWLAIAWCASLAVAWTWAQEVERVGLARMTTGKWQPFTGESLPHGGAVSRIVELAVVNMGGEVELRFLPFFIGYDRTLAGDYDATFPYVRTADREKEMLYSEPLAHMDLVMFYRRGSIEDPAALTNVEDFSPLRVGLVVGYSYEGLDLLEAENEERYPSEVMAFRALERGEVDLVPASKRVGAQLIRATFNDYFRSYDYLPNWSVRQSVHLIAPKSAENAERWMTSFNASLGRLREKGLVEAILTTEIEEPQVSSVVRLMVTTESHPMIIARESPDATEGYMVARGTRAVVLQWSRRYRESGEFRVFDQMFEKSQVRIIEGPLKGKVLWVDNMYIEVE